MPLDHLDVETLARRGREISVVAPERAAVVSRHGTLTFGDLDRQAEALAAHLADHGLAAGETLALLSTNRPEWLVAQQASLRAGLQLVPVNWHLEADDIGHVLRDSGAAALIVEDAFVDLVGDATPPIRITIGHPSYDEATSGDRSAPADRARGGLMIYTSGTTGRPKGVRHDASEPARDGAAIGAAMVAMLEMDGDRGDTMLCPAPLYHSGPSRLCGEWPLAAGVTVVVMDRFDPAEALRLIQHHRITHAFFVPTMFHRLLGHENRGDYDVSSLRFVLHGAGPCPVSVKHAMFDWLGPVIHEIYAASEGPGTWIGPDEWLAHPGSVGRVDPSRLEVRDDTGEVTPGEGTLWARAAAPFRYHDDPDKTAATFDSSGEWYTVGDRGRVDDEGYLYLTGRTAECIVSGGVNIYPARIDEALTEHPDVADGAAFGLPDRELGEIVAAAVVPAHEAAATGLADSVRSHCRQRVGAQLTPRVIHVVDRLPRSDAGKLYRRRLIETFSPTPDEPQESSR